MFSYTHLADTTRLMGIGYPLPYIFLAIPFLYLFTSTPTACLFRPFSDLLISNKSLTAAGNPSLDPRFLLGFLAGSFALLQSNLPDMMYRSAALFYSAFAHRPL
jgi:hypothetical protein